MSTHKHFDRICLGVLAVTALLTILFVNAGNLGVKQASTVMGYEKKLFDTSAVHTINILMDDWDEFVQNCKSEEYFNCTLVIDNEAYKNVAIRGKGNTSLTQVESYGNNRYSFKVEFDHYDSTNTYYGLDKLCLNNIIQDNTYMKDYLTYQLMGEMGAASPLCSYTYITVNGEDWGLYLAVEGVEEAFLQRNYGNDYGELYKPDSMGMGGGMGNSSDDILLKYIDDSAESYSNIFDNAKTDITEEDKTRLITALKNLSAGEALSDTVDIEEVIRYFVVHNFVLNFDSYTGSMIHNYYLYEKDGKLQMIPWDYNLAFGGFQSMGDAASLVNAPIDTPVSEGSVTDRPMLAWIFADEEYTELYHQYFSEFIADYFESGYFENMMKTVTELIAPYVEKDPTKFCTYEEFETGTATLQEFCELRAKSIRAQLEGTIGSTSETQDSATFISADDIRISDMGTMNNSQSGEGEMPQGNLPQGDPPQMPTDSTEMSGEEMPQGNMPQGDAPQGNPPQMPSDGNKPDGAMRGGQQADSSSKESESQVSVSDLIWLAVSLAVLAAGIGVVAIFKRRRH